MDTIGRARIFAAGRGKGVGLSTPASFYFGILCTNELRSDEGVPLPVQSDFFVCRWHDMVYFLVKNACNSRIKKNKISKFAWYSSPQSSSTCALFFTLSSFHFSKYGSIITQTCIHDDIQDTVPQQRWRNALVMSCTCWLRL